ncbi:hypothetical protein Y1Q_0008083 [Alligator mississippiensis]|uniref:Uncharacterized protein n=1 Tax=Alligator mississippiensis TaxID=8496 RepID=A0A151NFC8_ALLMI|nr:hypothetical protein Y1Q_0008083 [Alligator mississippiensis]
MEPGQKGFPTRALLLGEIPAAGGHDAQERAGGGSPRHRCLIPATGLQSLTIKVVAGENQRNRRYPTDPVTYTFSKAGEGLKNYNEERCTNQ